MFVSKNLPRDEFLGNRNVTIVPAPDLLSIPISPP